ncbi:MAG: Fpg/Nei family DNA glycosylase [Candidatus Dormibacteraeota bacterium]|nr:Fpg/Nei family DNA glycosylase [Candidatus Dormibacteraeota bacterium]
MPEGDTIWRAANALRPRLRGKQILSAEPDRFASLLGKVVTEVEANGKHLLIRFEGGLVLHTHMRMTGSWHLYRPGETWRRPARQAKVALANEDTVAVLFNAPVVELVRERELRLDHLGPDILAPDLDLQEVARRARRSSRTELGDVLLDQTVAAGIGNIYKCETMWRLRLNPWSAVAGLSDESLLRVYGEARRLMLVALRGRVPHAVHGRAGRGCPSCNSRIAIRNQGDPPRLTYFCPTCQRPGLR